MFGIDMSLWNRVSYPERKTVIKIVTNTGVAVVIAGAFSMVVTWPISKIVEILAS